MIMRIVNPKSLDIEMSGNQIKVGRQLSSRPTYDRRGRRGRFIEGGCPCYLCGAQVLFVKPLTNTETKTKISSL